MSVWFRRQWRAYLLAYRASRDASQAARRRGASFAEAFKTGMDKSR